MTTIKGLLENYECLWVYIGQNKELREAFADELKDAFPDEGRSMENNVPFDSSHIGDIMAIHRDGRLNYVSYMVWTGTFHTGCVCGSDGVKIFGKEFLKVDFKKLKNGEADYEVTTPNVRKLQIKRDCERNKRAANYRVNIDA